MRIGACAKSARVSVETIRFYETKGLIQKPPKPLAGGYRSYDADTVRRVRFIRSAQQLGFSLKEVAELLDLKTLPGTHCHDVRARAEEKRREVQEKIENLEDIRATLDALIARCPGEGPAAECSILTALNQDASKPDISSQ